MSFDVQHILVYLSLIGAVCLLLSHFGLIGAKRSAGCAGSDCSCDGLKKTIEMADKRKASGRSS